MICVFISFFTAANLLKKIISFAKLTKLPDKNVKIQFGIVFESKTTDLKIALFIKSIW